MRTTTLEPLSSSDARAAILSCHDELRGLVEETMHSAENAGRSSEWGDFEPLRAHALELYEAFEEHMNFEERILPTALRDVIGWGSELQAQVVEGHEKLRADLAAAMLALKPDAVSRVRLIESVRAFVDTLLEDLTTEERCLLRADLDAMASDAHGG
jgi:hypothetical protein